MSRRPKRRRAPRRASQAEEPLSGSETSFGFLSWTRRTGVRFALVYAAIASVLFGVYAFPFELFGAQEDWLTGYLEGYARLSGGLLWVFDRGVQVSGTFIHGRFPLQIVRNCDAAEINILFISAVLAFPATWRRRALSLLLGVVTLVFANVLRICCLYFVGVHSPAWFEVAHEEVWPLLLVVVAALVFLRAVRYMQSEGVPDVAFGHPT